jgi:phosphoribosylformimino-5-aminoimidazole carboxamide ribotide isomerase
MRIIPAIDIINGECVRLTEGDYSTRQAYGDPVSAARRFAAAGARWLQVVDLEGAREGRVVNWSSLSAILGLDGIQVQFGGGVRSAEDASRIFDLGAQRIIVGSIAVASPQLFQEWIERFSAERFGVAVDVKGAVLVSHAWLTEEVTPLAEVITRVKNLGVRTMLCTDVTRDGTLTGPNIALYKRLVGEFPSLRWIAAGGVRSREDLLALKETKVDAVVVGKAFYDGTLTDADLREFSC